MLSAAELAASHTRPRITCCLSFCVNPRKRYRRKRVNGYLAVDERFCHRHLYELSHGGIFIDIDDDWED